MIMKVSKDWLYNYSRRLLEMSGVDDDIIETDLESLVYEAGSQYWVEYEHIFIIEDDYE